jgi:hypothetical protein
LCPFFFLLSAILFFFCHPSILIILPFSVVNFLLTLIFLYRNHACLISSLFITYTYLYLFICIFFISVIRVSFFDLVGSCFIVIINNVLLETIFFI